MFQDVFPSDIRGLRIDLCGLCVKLLLLVAAMLLQVIRGYVFPQCLNHETHTMALAIGGQLRYF